MRNPDDPAVIHWYIFLCYMQTNRLITSQRTSFNLSDTITPIKHKSRQCSRV